jgi:hypothetical protein
MDFQALGRILLIVGLAIVFIGGALVVLGGTGIFNRFGALPGDIRIEGQGFTCLMPIVSSILLSVIFTVILNLIIRFINKP